MKRQRHDDAASETNEGRERKSRTGEAAATTGLKCTIAEAIAIHFKPFDAAAHANDLSMDSSGQARLMQGAWNLAPARVNALMALLYPAGNADAAKPNSNATMRSVEKSLGSLDGVSIVDLFLLTATCGSNAGVDLNKMMAECKVNAELRTDYGDRICNWVDAVAVAELCVLPVVFVGGGVAWTAFNLLVAGGKQ